MNLTERFIDPPPGTMGPGPCPEAAALARAAAGESPRAEFDEMLEHAAGCPACTVSWRLIREWRRGEMISIAAPPAASGWRLRATVAAAAALILGVSMTVLFWPVPAGRESSEFRAATDRSIVSLLPAGTAQPREDCLLRWSAGPPGTRYNVLVTGEDLGKVAEVRLLQKPEFRVPSEALAGLKPGSRIFWQVEATLPDGYTISSATFSLNVE